MRSATGATASSGLLTNDGGIGVGTGSGTGAATLDLNPLFSRVGADTTVLSNAQLEIGALASRIQATRGTAVETTIAGKSSGEGTGPQTVTVTLDGLLDDSVRAERWTLVFQQEGETYVLTNALREQRCQPQRGHQGFSADDCV